MTVADNGYNWHFFDAQGKLVRRLARSLS